MKAKKRVKWKFKNPKLKNEARNDFTFFLCLALFARCTIFHIFFNLSAC